MGDDRQAEARQGPDPHGDDPRWDGAVSDHLALMARSGLMTHEVELAPPVTAEAVARFRAGAAAQATNVMAVGPGRFALCLPPGIRTLDVDVSHRIRPIGRADGGTSRRAPQATGPEATIAPADAPAPAPAPERPRSETTGPDPMVAALAEGQIALAGRLDALGAQIGAQIRAQIADAAARMAEGHAATEALASALAERIAGQIGAQEARRADRLGRQIEAAHAAQAETLSEVMLRLDGLDARLDGIYADRGTEPQPDDPPEDRIATLDAVLQEHAAETGEALATLRLGLRAVNERLDALPARLRDAPEQGRDAESAPPSRSATVTPLPVPARGASAETVALTRGLADLVARLDTLLGGTSGEHADAPLWRRNLRDRPGSG